MVSSTGTQKTRKQSSLVGHKAPVLCLEYCELNDCLLSGSEDGTVRMWDLKSGKSIKAIRPSLEKEDTINSISVASNFVYIAHGTNVVSYDIRRPEVVVREHSWKMKPNKEEINQITISSDGQHLAMCDDDNSVKVMSLQSFELVRSMRKHTNISTSIKFRPGTTEILSGGFDCNVLQCDFKKNKLNHKYEQTLSKDDSGNIMNPPYVHSLDVSQNGSYAVVGCGNGSIDFLDLNLKASSNSIPQAHTSAINQVRFASFSENYVVSCSNDKMIKLWNMEWPKAEDVAEAESLANKINGLKKVLSTQKNSSNESIYKTQQKLNLYEQSHQNINWKCQYSLDIGISHKIKMNWITTSPTGNIFVGDISNDISRYLVQL